MKKCGTLPRCDMTNIFTSLTVVDIDFDGSKEILIGNSVEVRKYNHSASCCTTIIIYCRILCCTNLIKKKDGASLI